MARIMVECITMVLEKLRNCEFYVLFCRMMWDSALYAVNMLFFLTLVNKEAPLAYVREEYSQPGRKREIE